METYWLDGTKSAYKSVIDQEAFYVNDEEDGGTNANPGSMPRNQQQSSSPNVPFNDQQIPKRQSPLNNVINKQLSVSSGQCPFSAH